MVEHDEHRRGVCGDNDSNEAGKGAEMPMIGINIHNSEFLCGSSFCRRFVGVIKQSSQYYVASAPALT